MTDMGWDDIPEGGFAALPPDTYVVRVTGLEPTVGQEKGTAYWKGDFVVIEGEYEDRHLFTNLMADATIAPGAMGKTKGLVSATKTKFPKGLTLQEAIDKLNEVREDLLGQECLAVVGQRMKKDKQGQDTGELSNEIKRFMPIG